MLWRTTGINPPAITPFSYNLLCIKNDLSSCLQQKRKHCWQDSPDARQHAVCSPLGLPTQVKRITTKVSLNFTHLIFTVINLINVWLATTSDPNPKVSIQTGCCHFLITVTNQDLVTSTALDLRSETSQVKTQAKLSMHVIKTCGELQLHPLSNSALRGR
jgi:hypothetical protein